MAKKSRRRSNNRLNVTAESIGTGLGRVAVRLEAWKRQRRALAGELQRVLDSARTLLGELGETTSRVVAKRPARGRRTSSKGGRPKGFRVSEATRRKLRAAWKRRKKSAGKAVSE